MDELLDQIASHCRQAPRGDCGTCSQHDACRQQLMPLVDRLFLMVHDLWADQHIKNLGAMRYAETAGRKAIHRWMYTLSFMVMDIGNTRPIGTIDQVVRESRSCADWS